MICEKCKGKMNKVLDAEHSTQGWVCPICGWSIVTTYIEEIFYDATEYSLYISNVSEIDMDKIKFIAEIACVNYLMAKQMLEKEKVCILKAKAPKIKETISKLQEKNFEFYVTPSFIY